MTDDKDTGISEALSALREPIYRYVLQIVKDPPQAEDVTQETFLRAHHKASSLRDRSRLVPWLYRIATNACHDHFRKTAGRKRLESLEAGDDDSAGSRDPADDGSVRFDRVMEQEEMGACVQRYFLDLPDPHRAVLLLHDVEGLTNPEIAAMLGISLATVKIRLHRARARLREALDEACLFSSDERGVLVCEPKPVKIDP